MARTKTSSSLFCMGALATALGLSLVGGCRTTTTVDEPRDTKVAEPTPDASDDAEVIAASDLPDTIERPLPGDDMGVTIHRLSNGMTVYLSTDRQKPRFTAWIGVRAGSRHDPADSTGLAHYLEHMLFKG